jgi:hypothetical protein
MAPGKSGMKNLDKVMAMAAAVALLLVCGFASDPAQVPGADIIVTSAPVYNPVAALRGDERFPQGAQLLLIHAGNSEPLVTGFAAAADANVSFDAKTVLFAGKQAAGDPWADLGIEHCGSPCAQGERVDKRCNPPVLSALWPLRLCAAHSPGISTGSRWQGSCDGVGAD